MSRYILAALLWGLSISATADDSLKTVLINKSGKAVSRILARDSSTSKVENVLGRPDKVEEKDGLKKYYYEIDGYRYKLIVSFHSGQVSSVQYLNLEKDLTLASLGTLVDRNKLELSKNLRQPGSNGRYLIYKDKAAGLRVWFRNNQNKSVARWEVVR